MSWEPHLKEIDLGVAVFRIQRDVERHYNIEEQVPAGSRDNGRQRRAANRVC